MLRPDEQRQLRALVTQAWPDRHDPEKARDHAERIVEWNYSWPLARGDIQAIRAAARAALAHELDRQRRLPTVDDLVGLLRRTDPASVSHDRKGVADDAA